MRQTLSRREMLKFSVILPFLLSQTYMEGKPSALRQPAAGQKNIIMILFDTLTASHVNLYGYRRETMPNLSRFAERAIVYHNHFSSGNFTSPGTASLLTGTHAWTHRAIKYYGQVTQEFTQKNIFSLFDAYHRVAYSHNPLANIFFNQFKNSLDELKPREDLYVTNSWLNKIFQHDFDIINLSTLICKKTRQK